MNETDIQAVRGVLQKFQEGHDRRDPAALDAFRKLFVEDSDLEVIGTGGINPGEDEWCVGPDQAIELVKNDWEGWGDLRLDVPGARIFALGDVAWLAANGTVSMVLKHEETYKNYLEYIGGQAKEQEGDPRAKLFEIMRGVTNTLFEGERGDHYVWPIRFTSVLVRRDGQWRFHQMQFSFATTRYPDVRNL